MFDNVFVGIDGSPAGRDAIALAQQLAAANAQLTLVNVYPGELSLDSGSSQAVNATAREDSQRLLEAERDNAGIAAELRNISSTSVGRGLHAFAELHDADLLVVGSSRRGLLGRVLVGDDTRASLNGAPCAIAVAPTGYASHEGGLAAIGVGYDFSPESHAALAAARELAGRTGATISALYVATFPSGAYAYGAPMPSDWGEILEQDEKATAEKIKALEGVNATAQYGVTGEELSAFGDRVNLLVVGSRNYGPTRRLVLGSTSNHLARHARCPLLVLPRGANVLDPSSVNGSGDRVNTPVT